MEPTPSLFWQELGSEQGALLREHGFQYVKRKQALRYFSWRWRPSTLWRSDQLRFLLRNTTPRELVSSLGPSASREQWEGVDWSAAERYAYSVATRLLWQYARRFDRLAILRLGEPRIGSPLPVFLHSNLVSQDLANSAIEVGTAIYGWSRRPKHIVEIGAGYGRSAYVLLSLFPEAQYTVIDIEPALSISRWYLTQLFDADRLIFLAADCAEDLEPADFAISISSLQEMTRLQVDCYLSLLDARVVSGARVYLKQWTEWRNPVDDIAMRLRDYPIPERWHRKLFEPAPVQTSFSQGVWEVP